jgi:hypothetical protein
MSLMPAHSRIGYDGVTRRRDRRDAESPTRAVARRIQDGLYTGSRRRLYTDSVLVRHRRVAFHRSVASTATLSTRLAGQPLHIW